MALKADRHELQTDISFFMNEVATRGGIAILSTGGSGAAMDQSNALVTYAKVPTTTAALAISGIVPVGLLLNDMVNLDLTRQHINWHKDEVQKGGKVTLLRKGWVVTNSVDSATGITAGQTAYASSGTAGNLTAKAPSADDERERLVVGRFLSKADEDGYVKVAINLPNHGDTSAFSGA